MYVHLRTYKVPASKTGPYAVYNAISVQAKAVGQSNQYHGCGETTPRALDKATLVPSTRGKENPSNRIPFLLDQPHSRQAVNPVCKIKNANPPARFSKSVYFFYLL